MKVCILTAGHDPWDERIFDREVMTLLNDGFNDISIIAPFEKEYGVMEGVEIYGFRKRGASSIPSKFGMLKRLYKKALSLKADVYHCHEPHTLIVGTWVKRKLGSKIIYDAHEYHPEQFSERYGGPLRKLVYTLVHALEKHYTKKADYVFTVCEELVEKFRSWGCKALFVPNYAKDYHKLNFAEDPQIMQLKKCGFTVGIFAGGMYRERGILEFIEATGILKDRRIKAAAVFVGWCDKDFEGLMRECVKYHGLEDRVVILPEKSHMEVLNMMSQCDFGFINDYPERRNLKSTAVKFFEYMLCSLPIYASDLPENRRILTEEKCGVFADPTSPKEIADRLEVLCSDTECIRQMGGNARKAFESKYNWSLIEGTLIDCYRKLEGEVNV